MTEETMRMLQAEQNRFAEMNDVFHAFRSSGSNPPVIALTRTRYDIERSSLFAPL